VDLVGVFVCLGMFSHLAWFSALLGDTLLDFVGVSSFFSHDHHPHLSSHLSSHLIVCFYFQTPLSSLIPVLRVMTMKIA
jgi:hypothetical protein